MHRRVCGKSPFAWPAFTTKEIEGFLQLAQEPFKSDGDDALETWMGSESSATSEADFIVSTVDEHYLSSPATRADDSLLNSHDSGTSKRMDSMIHYRFSSVTDGSWRFDTVPSLSPIERANIPESTP